MSRSLTDLAAEDQRWLLKEYEDALPNHKEELEHALSTIDKEFREGLISENERRKQRSELTRIFTPESMLSDTYLLEIRKFIFKLHPELSEHLNSVPIVLLPKKFEWDAFAYRLPSGKPFVAVNLCFTSLTRAIVCLTQDLIASDLNGDRKRFIQCVRGLIAGAAFVSTNDFAHLTLLRTLVPRASKRDNWVSMCCMLMTCFVLLHEFGHLELAHIDLDLSIPQRGNVSDVRLLSHRLEYEADDFALTKMKTAGKGKDGQSVVWMWVAVLLRIPAHREHPFRSIVSTDSGRT